MLTKPLPQGRVHGADLGLLLVRVMTAGRKQWHVCSLVPLPPDAPELGS
jgi:hypothetical protein